MTDDILELQKTRAESEDAVQAILLGAHEYIREQRAQPPTDIHPALDLVELHYDECVRHLQGDPQNVQAAMAHIFYLGLYCRYDMLTDYAAITARVAGRANANRNAPQKQLALHLQKSEGLPATEIQNRLVQRFGEDAVTTRTVREWLKSKKSKRK